MFLILSNNNLYRKINNNAKIFENGVENFIEEYLLCAVTKL